MNPDRRRGEHRLFADGPGREVLLARTRILLGMVLVVARSLGRLRAFDALPDLLGILEPDAGAREECPDLDRAFAAAVLGWIAHRDADDPLDLLGSETDWIGPFPALEELLSVL